MSWDGFDNRIIANRQKDTFVHGFVDISGTFKTQSLLTTFDVPALQQYAANTTVKSYTSNNPGYAGTYQIDGLTGLGNAIIPVSNIAGGAAFAGNSSIITSLISPNLLALGANISVPKYANVAINMNVPLGTNLTFNANIANVFYGNSTYSNIVLNATTNANIGNITLFETQDYLKANCSYKTADPITIPLGMSVTGSLNFKTNLPGITNNPTNPVVYAAVNANYTVLAFTSVGSYNLQFNNNTQIGYIVVGGGGGGSNYSTTTSNSGGGGGGGGLIYGTISSSNVTLSQGTNYIVTIGSGGAGGSGGAVGSNGSSSSIIGGGITITANGGNGGTSSAGGTGGTASISGVTGGTNTTATGASGGANGVGSVVGNPGSNGTSFTISDICSNQFQVVGGGGGGGGNQLGSGTRAGGSGGSGGGGGGVGSNAGTASGNAGSFSIFSSSSTGITGTSTNAATVLPGATNTGGGGGSYPSTGTPGGAGGSGVIYIYFTTSNSTPAVFSNITYRTAAANSTSITQTPVTIANVTVPPYYSGNALSLYVPIAANIVFAPSTNYNLNGGATGNTISFLTTINNVYANIYQNTTATSYANITLTPNMNSNIFVQNKTTTPIYFGANITSSTAPTTLRLKQYLYTANITFTPAYSTLTNNYLVNMYSTGNIVGSNATVGSAAVNTGLLGNIEYNSITYFGNVNATVAGSVTGNYTAGNVTVGGNYSTGPIYSVDIGPYSGNVLFVNSYNQTKPNIQITYAPNIFLLNSANTLKYSLVQGDYANNYITTVKVPDLDTSVATFNTSYTANIILGNINIPQHNANIFANINTTDFHKLVAVGNLKVTVNNFPNTIANITTYANPPFNTSDGTGIFANSLTATTPQQLNNLNFNGYNALSGNISLSKTFLNYSVTLANVTIMDQFMMNTTGNVTGSTTSGVSYTVNGTSGQLAPQTISSTYSNIVAGQTYTMADFIGNVVLAGVYLPTTNPTTSTGIYTPYLSLVGNISAPYTTTIVNANVFSNIAAASPTTGFFSTSNVNIIDNNTLNNNAIGTTGATATLVQGVPALSGNVYANNMTTNNLTVAGHLNVRQYSTQNIIATTTTTYNQLVVSEDLALNGRLFTTGNVGIGKTDPAVALDVVGNVRCTAGIDLNYSTVPTYAPNQIGYTLTSTTLLNSTINITAQAACGVGPISAGVWLLTFTLSIQGNGAYVNVLFSSNTSINVTGKTDLTGLMFWNYGTGGGGSNSSGTSYDTRSYQYVYNNTSGSKYVFALCQTNVGSYTPYNIMFQCVRIA